MLCRAQEAMGCSRQVSKRADLCFRNIEPEFCLKTFPRELFHWNGGCLLSEWEGAKRAMNNGQILQKSDCYGKGNMMR